MSLWTLEPYTLHMHFSHFFLFFTALIIFGVLLLVVFHRSQPITLRMADSDSELSWMRVGIERDELFREAMLRCVIFNHRFLEQDPSLFIGTVSGILTNSHPPKVYREKRYVRQSDDLQSFIDDEGQIIDSCDVLHLTEDRRMVAYLI